jgi:hypothetical protein
MAGIVSASHSLALQSQLAQRTSQKNAADKIVAFVSRFDSSLMLAAWRRWVHVD